MPGLVPGIHGLVAIVARHDRRKKPVDGRDSRLRRGPAMTP
jgi:hypothetical protein